MVVDEDLVVVVAGDEDLVVPEVSAEEDVVAALAVEVAEEATVWGHLKMLWNMQVSCMHVKVTSSAK